VEERCVFSVGASVGFVAVGSCFTGQVSRYPSKAPPDAYGGGEMMAVVQRE
jgi:hypothetical protein